MSEGNANLTVGRSGMIGRHTKTSVISRSTNGRFSSPTGNLVQRCSGNFGSRSEQNQEVQIGSQNKNSARRWRSSISIVAKDSLSVRMTPSKRAGRHCRVGFVTLSAQSDVERDRSTNKYVFADMAVRTKTINRRRADSSTKYNQEVAA